MTTLLTLIAAVSEDGFISRGQGVPWKLPADVAHFRAYTTGKWLLLGRRTYEEMLGWFRDHMPLVLSRDQEFVTTIGQRVSSIAEALQRTAADELVVCGGAQAYALAMPLADRLVLTQVQTHLGDGVPFPEIDWSEWTEISREPHTADAEHAHAFEIVTWERTPGA
jgi:dihydrofolate reductase